MTRTEKCMLLRLLIKSIAQSNHIVPLSSRCDYHCDCDGNCKKLGAELGWLFDELEKIGVSSCTNAAQRLYGQRMCGLHDPENFEPKDLFFVQRKSFDENMEAALLEEDAPYIECFDDASSVSDDTGADIIDPFQE